jgi:hypothetical protein
MKLKYLINDDPTHYVQFSLDLATKTIKAEYIRFGDVAFSNTADASSVLNIEPSINPQVEIAKKDKAWDFHLFKTDAYGVEHRKSVGLLTGDTLTPTKVDMSNESANTIALKNYITHRLDVYNSSLAIAHYPFDTLDGVAGNTSVTEDHPMLTPSGQLEMGYNSAITLDLINKQTLAANGNTVPYNLVLKVDKLGANDISGLHQLEMQLGDNVFKFDDERGLSMENPKLANPEIVTPLLNVPFTFRLVVVKGVATLYVNNTRFALILLLFLSDF